jgi:tRNA (cmo5U34)-methyltransferase
MLDKRRQQVARWLEAAEDSRWDYSQLSDYWENFPNPGHYGMSVAQFLPEHEVVHSLLLDAVGMYLSPASKVLDLGAGSGRVARMIMDRFPDTEVTLVDASPHMLRAVSETLAGLDGRYETVIGDFFQERLDLQPQSFDCIISVFAICQGRELGDYIRLYADIYRWLRPSGAMVCLDHVRGANGRFTLLNVTNWQEFMLRSFPPSQVEAAIITAYQLDNPLALYQHLTLLAAAGFTETDVLYKRDMFAIYSGIKSLSDLAPP